MPRTSRKGILQHSWQQDIVFDDVQGRVQVRGLFCIKCGIWKRFDARGKMRYELADGTVVHPMPPCSRKAVVCQVAATDDGCAE